MHSAPIWRTVQNKVMELGLGEMLIRTLGWNAPSFNPIGRLDIDHITWAVDLKAEIGGCGFLEISDLQTRNPKEHRKVLRAVSKYYTDAIVLFRGQTMTTWYWPSKLSEGVSTSESFVTKNDQVPDFLAQRLASLSFVKEVRSSSITPSLVRARIRGTVENANVTAGFYKRFKKEHAALADNISGLSQAEAESYASLMLNRLMFIYFLQKKEFLNGDADYLSRCLTSIQNLRGPDKFYSFYKEFLLELFFEHLNSAERNSGSTDMAAIIGRVPYLNGGIFGQHETERSNDISIPDSAFSSIFDFFRSYTWHLDTRPLGASNEINPEVLGYIFEQYINFEASGKKKNGAYYTKPDVTGYMVSHTLGQALLDILSAHGIDVWQIGATHLPKEFMPSIFEGEPSEGALSKSATISFLPGERELERAWRISRGARLRQLLSSGTLSQDDVTTQGLVPINFFAEAVLGIDQQDTLESIWSSLLELKVLDPACGSGAFLFSALECLELAYASVLDALESTGAGHSAILDHVSSHPNRKYFIRKTVMLQNLHGVDLMSDAVETAKLRLFLSLAACIDNLDDLEPLPDLDFNVVAGNSLFGLAMPEDVARYADGDIFLAKSIANLEPKISAFVTEIAKFRAKSLQGEHLNKSPLQTLKRSLEEECDTLISENISSQSDLFDPTMKPFHWFITFGAITASGGFDVVIGNPPYIRARNYTDDMRRQITGFSLAAAPDLYAVFLERMLQLTKTTGRFGAVVPISLACGLKFHQTRRVVGLSKRTEWWSTFDQLPLGLFTPADVRNTILLLGPCRDSSQTFVSQHHIFTVETRPWLFDRVYYAPQVRDGGETPRRSGIASNITDAIAQQSLQPGPRSDEVLAFRPSANYWVPILPKVPPTFDVEFNVENPADPRVEKIDLMANESKNVVMAIAAGKIGFLWWQAVGDGMDVYLREFEAIRAVAQRVKDDQVIENLSCRLMREFDAATIANKYDGRVYANIRWPNLSHITDLIDQRVLALLGLPDEWVNLETWYAQVMRSNDSRNQPAPSQVVRAAWGVTGLEVR